MRLLDRRVQPGRAVTAILLVLVSCASVTRTSRLESDAGGNWITESMGADIVVESTGGVKTTGRLLGAKAEVALGLVLTQSLGSPNPENSNYVRHLHLEVKAARPRAREDRSRAHSPISM